MMKPMTISLTTTATALLTQSLWCNKVTIQSNMDNEGIVYVGSSNGLPFLLAPGDSIDMEPNDASEIFVKSSKAGDSIGVMIYG